jgi:flavodoxin
MSKAIVVYDSKYGNTKKVAEDIALAIEGEGIEVVLKAVKDTSYDEVNQYDLVVIGSPTHINNPKKDTKKFLKKLKGTDLKNIKFAAFDTRINDAKKGAIIKIETALMELGATKVTNGLVVSVLGMKGPLEDSAQEKSKAYGSVLGKKIK